MATDGKTRHKSKQQPSPRNSRGKSSTGDRISARIGLKRRLQLAELAEQTGEQESALVRQAIDLLLDQAGAQPSCYDQLREAGAIGLIEDAPSDLSTNPKYLEGFGRDRTRAD